MIAVRALAAAVESAGVCRRRYLAAAGMSEAPLDDVYARISMSDYDRARRAALTLSGDPALGLHMGGAPSISSFDFLGTLAEHSKDLREALQVAVQYAGVIVEGATLELVEQRDVVIVRSPQLRGEAPEVRLSAEFTASSLVHLVRRFVGGSSAPRRVFFGYARPSHHAEYARVFGGREQFSHAFTGVEFERSWLERSHTYGSSEIRALLLARAQRFLACVEDRAPTAERVKRWLASQSPEARPTMDVIARDLGMSGRSLRRRLGRERAPYDDLVREARVARAKSMLAESPQSIQEVAYALGFETPAAFSRAFRRWTGMPPSAFRADAQTASDPDALRTFLSRS